MRSLPRSLRPALAVLLLVGGTGCGSEEPVPSGERPLVAEADNPSVASAIADPTAPRIISVVVDGGRISGDIGTVALKRNVPVQLVVISDSTDTLLVQGYDLRALASAEVPVQLEFRASRAGEFPVVLEKAGKELTRLRVS